MALPAPTPQRFLPVARPVATPVPAAPAAPLDPAAEGQAPFTNRYAAPDLGAPVGQWSRVRSTWLFAIRYDPYPAGPYGDMQFEMTDGAVLLWENTSREDYLSFWTAASKGRRLNAWARRSDYSTVRGAQYRGAALAARVHANA